MQTLNLQPINWPELTPEEIATFDLSTRHGRSYLADRISADIDAFSKHVFADERRKYMGASQIGNECNRFLWNNFRWIKEETFDGRMLRLFNTGHREEEMIIMYLRGLGFTVEEIDPATNKQYRIYAASGHVSGSCDGLGLFPERYKIGDHVRLLFEFKSANERISKLVENTGYRDAKPVHWSQTCMYGVGFETEYCLYISKNKNTDGFYVEIEQLDLEFGRRELEKAAALVQLPTPPPTLYQNSMMPPCKWCHFKGSCYGSERAEKNCRSCVNAVPTTNPEGEAAWGCTLYNAIIAPDFIPKGCDHWQSILTAR